MATENTTVPSSFVQGDTVTWTRSFTDYPASDGWALTYAFVRTGDQQTATGSADGDEFDVTITAANSASFSTGEYKWQEYVTKGAERHTTAEGTVQVELNLVDQTTGYDGRTHNEKVLDAIKAAVEGRADQTQASYSVSTSAGSTSISHMTHDELIRALRIYEGRVERERRTAGEQNRGKVNVRWR